MSKDSDLRLTDTINFIERDADLPCNAAYKGNAAEWCRFWKGKVSVDVQRQISDLISQGWNTDGETTRKYRRAITLLGQIADAVQWDNFALRNTVSMVGPSASAAINKKIKSGNVKSALDKCVEITLGAVGDKEFMDAKFDELKGTPLAFLQGNRLKISGAANGRKVYKFYQYIDNGEITYGLQANKPNENKYDRAVKVINVGASSFTDTKAKAKGLKGLDKIIGTEVAATDDHVFMTTTQFTGCSFCMQKCGTNLVAAHMDPEGVIKKTGLTGPGIRQELLGGFGFDNVNLSQPLQGDPFVYGCKDNGDDGWGYEQANRNYMTIVGVYLDVGWRLFTQFNAVDRSFSARQIYPRP